jgi:hypothetical protein
VTGARADRREYFHMPFVVRPHFADRLLARLHQMKRDADRQVLAAISSGLRAKPKRLSMIANG